MLHTASMAALVAGLLTTPATATTDTPAAPTHTLTAVAPTAAPALDFDTIASAVRAAHSTLTAKAPTATPSATRFWLYGALAAAQAGDVITTTVDLRRGAVEANGVMKGVADSPVKLALVKAAVSAGIIGVAEKLWRSGDKKAAITTLVITTAASALLVGNNLRVHSQLKAR